MNQIPSYFPAGERVKALPFSPHDVWLLDGPFKKILDSNGEYLLSLEPDRLLSLFRKSAGLAQKAEPYGGWESMGVAGHSLGHLLSGLAWHYAVANSAQHKSRLELLVKGLVECQKARSDGYVGAIPDADRVWEEIRRGELKSQGFDLNGLWVPWYTQHKIFAGLIDAYLLCESKLALDVVSKLGDWAIDVTKNLTPEQWQTMLACEHGGMNESLLDLHRLTGEKRFLDLAHKFDHKAVLDPLRAKEDKLAGLHSNTQVPKVIGLAKEYERSGKESEKTASAFFWDRIVRARTYANGGNSNFEHLTQAGVLRDQLSMNTSETCNTYNMLKLSRHLFSWGPKSEIGDFTEKALYNHILASQDGEPGHFTYYVPLSGRSARPYSDPTNDFWCCVGTGMENPARAVENIYFAGDKELFVNLFVPSRLEWKRAEVIASLTTDYPSDQKVSLTLVHAEKKEFTLAIRLPAWVSGQLVVKINGKKAEAKLGEDGFARLKRTWISGDVVTWEVPLTVRTEAMPDDPKRIAFFHGPLLLAAGTEDFPYDPVFVAEPSAAAAAFKREPGKGIAYSSTNLPRPKDLVFRPFFSFTKGRHTTYFDALTTGEWAKKEAEIKAEEAKAAALAAMTTDMLRIGEMQPERDHNLVAENSQTGAHNNRNWRHAQPNGFFQFDLSVDPEETHELLLTFWSGDAGRDFHLLLDGKIVINEPLKGPKEVGFFDLKLPLDLSLTKGKKKVTVRFQATAKTLTPGLYGCRMMKMKE